MYQKESTTQNEISEIINQPILPEIYGLREAFHDAFYAIKSNISLITILSVIGVAVPAIAYIGISNVIAADVSHHRYIPHTKSEDALFFKVVPLFLLCGLMIMIFSAFMQIAISLAINDGAERRVTNIKEIIITALKRTPRILLVGLFFTLLVGSPLLLFGLILLAISFLTQGIAPHYLIFGPVAIGLTIYLFLRFALMPTVAIFEPSLGLKQLYMRTKRLMSVGGALFYLKLALVGFLVNIVLSFLSSSSKGIAEIGMIADTFIFFALPIITAALSVVYYRNRLLARG